MTLVIPQRGVASPAFRKVAERSQVILFINDNMSGAAITKNLVPRLLQVGIEPILVVLHPTASERAQIPELKDFSFYDSLIGRHISPHFYSNNILSGANDNNNMVPAHLADIAIEYNVALYSINNANKSPEILSLLRNPDKPIMGAISIRNMQIFKPELIQAFARNGAFLWNLHSGDLPAYRGVHPILRAMVDKKKMAGWTLHVVDQGIDTGPIILDSDKGRLHLENAYLTEFFRKLPEAADLIVEALDAYRVNKRVITHPNDPKKGAYYTFPTAEELADWKERDLRLVDPEKMIKFYVDFFNVQDMRKQGPLKHEIEKAIDLWTEARRSGHMHMLPRTGGQTAPG